MFQSSINRKCERPIVFEPKSFYK